jgi:hypothetical protein
MPLTLAPFDLRFGIAPEFIGCDVFSRRDTPLPPPQKNSTARPEDDDSQLKPTTSRSVPTSTSHSALITEKENTSSPVVIPNTTKTDPALNTSAMTVSTPTTSMKRATTTTYDPPRITRESIEGVVAAFAKGRNLGDKVSSGVRLFPPFLSLALSLSLALRKNLEFSLVRSSPVPSRLARECLDRHSSIRMICESLPCLRFSFWIPT